MADYADVLGMNELSSGQMKMVNLAGEEVLIARIDDTFYATQNRCPHMGGNLSMGTLEKTVVTCPRHHSRFDLTDGQVVRWTDWSGLQLTLAKLFKAPRPLKTYRVKTEGGRVFVNTERLPAAVG